MGIYKKNRVPSKVYRRIYEQHHGKIQKDEEGRTYEIHHKDGDDSNNDPSNLVALSIKDHYDLHYSQGDWAACLAMSERMSLTVEEKSYLASQSIKKRMNNPTYVNPFAKRQDGSSVITDMMKDGWRPPVKNGKENSSYDHTLYEFENVITGEIISSTQYDFRIRFLFNADKVSKIVKDKSHPYKGWRLYSEIPYVKPKRKSPVFSSTRMTTPKDTKIYHFANDDGREVKMRQGEFQKEFSLVGSNVARLVSGERKIHRGWRLIS